MESSFLLPSLSLYSRFSLLGGLNIAEEESYFNQPLAIS